MANIRLADQSDWPAIWPIFDDVVSHGETYPYDRDTSYEEGERLWLSIPYQTFVAEEQGQILGTYYIKANQPGAGSHVCNCGYMVSPEARGKGIATLLCEHSQRTAIQSGFKAMQFNLVVSTNEAGVYLWSKLGFETIGRLPSAFKHPSLGFVDALVMYKILVN